MTTASDSGISVADGIISGPLRRSVNNSSTAKGSIHDDATASKLGFRGGTVAGDHDVIFLDEPTNGLDIPSKTVFRKVVSSSLSEDQSLLISTHQVKDVENLLDRVVVVEGGRVIFNEELFAVASKFRFDFHPGSALPEKYLYAEPVPGGHVVMSANADPQTQTEVDIEILFNAIISKSI